MDDRGWVHARGNGETVTIHNRMLSVTPGWVRGTRAEIPDHCSAYIRQPTYCSHLVNCSSIGIYHIGKKILNGILKIFRKFRELAFIFQLDFLVVVFFIYKLQIDNEKVGLENE